MKRLLTGMCSRDHIFELVDPTRFFEIDFEAEVVKALSCLFPQYWCGVFAGAFVLEGDRRVADLALIHRSISHWFVVEVEIAGHDFDDRVLPQVRCFRYGEPEPSCITSLVRAFKQLERPQAEIILRHVPRYVAVISNMPDSMWSEKLKTLDVQFLTMSVYIDHKNRYAYEIDGSLAVGTESLGFGRYSAIDNCLRIPRFCGLPTGGIQIVDQFGVLSEWTVRDEAGMLWVSKRHGPALIPHESYVQLVRTFEGQISLRPSITRTSTVREQPI